MASFQEQLNEAVADLADLTEIVTGLQAYVNTNTTDIGALSSLESDVELLKEKLQLVFAPSETRYYLTREQLTDLSTKVARMTNLVSELETMKARLDAVLSKFGQAGIIT